MNSIVRRSILGSIIAMIVTPTIAKAKTGGVRRPASVFGRHPRDEVLDCYHPAFLNQDGRFGILTSWSVGQRVRPKTWLHSFCQ